MVFSALSANTLHLVIDMQRIFAEDTVWHTPVMADILPNIVTLCDTFGERTAFVKFMLPQSPEDADGDWKRYYARWSMMTRDAIAPGQEDLIEPLRSMAANRDQIEKTTYSVFAAPGFATYLKNRKIDTLVFSGVETDVCVYASVLDAIDCGLRVVMASDAVGSSDRDAHDAILKYVAPRLCDQLDIVSTQAICAAWTAKD